jgi:RNA polymerase sigma factor (sigma-70 family)
MMLIGAEPLAGSAASDLALAETACRGDQSAVLALLQPLHLPLYNLARRMVWHPADAEDLVQEALLRVLTRLSAYRGEARFGTWAYRVALNSMLNTRRRRMEHATVSFDQFGDDLDRALATSPGQTDGDPDQNILIEEVKIGCMTGMLLCLDRPARLAYILGEIFEIDSGMAASLCEVTPAAFRQRLSRARKALHGFVQQKCGQVSEAAACRCERMVGPMQASGMVAKDVLLFASCGQSLRGDIAILDAASRTVALYRDHPAYAPAQGFETWLKELLRSRPMTEILEK